MAASDRLSRLLVAALCCVGAGAGRLCAQPRPYVATTDPLSPAEERKRFHLPPGFEIQLVAAEPQIAKPINLAFDDRGRLYVTQSVEYPFPVASGRRGRDAVKVLEDTDGDGRADRVSTLVDGLNIPIGLCPVPGGAIVYSIPRLYRFRDSGDGRIERQVLFDGFGYRDTHGMINSIIWWLDGWLYACHGFANTSTIRGRDGQAITMESGNTFRFRMDGSHVEYFTHGQVNPFGLAFDPLGNLYSADCHTKPGYMLLRGAWYPSFGKPHDGLGFGPTLMEHSHGSTAIAGIAYYAADQFPPPYQGTLFIGNPVTGRINHDRLEVHGSSYRGIEQPDFLVCDDPWFRPVDVELAPDGSLYVADFYNRIIAHYEVPLDHPGRDHRRGRIWRIVYRGREGRAAPPRPMPDLNTVSVQKLLELLADPNLVVRTKATHQLAQRVGRPAAPAVRSLIAAPCHPWQRAHGLWVLHRLGELDAATVRRLAADPDRLVRVHLMKALAERPDWANPDLFELVRAGLRDPDAFVRRAAADALARHPQLANIGPLLELWSATPPDDTHLVHVARMALRDQLLLDGAFDYVKRQWSGRRAELRRLADVSLGAHTPAAARFVSELLHQAMLPAAEAGKYLYHAARYERPERLAAVFEQGLAYRQRPVAEQFRVLHALVRASQERAAKLPPPVRQWAARLIDELLRADRPVAIRQGIELARILNHRPAVGRIGELARSRSQPLQIRQAAMDTLVALDPATALTVVRQLLADVSEPATVRQKAVAALAAMNTADSRAALVDQLRVAPEQEAVYIGRALAFSEQGAERLLEEIEQGRAPPRLLLDQLTSLLLARIRRPAVKERIAKLKQDLPPQDERITALIATRRRAFLASKPELQRGAQVFQKHCAVCHQLRGAGTKVGPELDGIGNRGLDRLLEDILDPNRNVDQAFRTTLIGTTDGRIVSGLLLRQEGQVLVLVDSQGNEVRVPAGQVEQRAVSKLSPMPANVADLVSPSDFNHLVGYLLSQRTQMAGSRPGPKPAAGSGQ